MEVGFILFHASGMQTIGCVAHSLYYMVLEERKLDKFIPDGIYIYIYIYLIMKTICSPGYHQNGFVAIHALWDMMYIMYTMCPSA